jgi:DNA-binding beta-propeller fold protein YncE
MLVCKGKIDKITLAFSLLFLVTIVSMSNITSNVNAQNLITSFKYPEDVDVDPSGNVFVADTFNSRIQKFTNTGDFIRTWGSFGAR